MGDKGLVDLAAMNIHSSANSNTHVRCTSKAITVMLQTDLHDPLLQRHSELIALVGVHIL